MFELFIEWRCVLFRDFGDLISFVGDTIIYPNLNSYCFLSVKIPCIEGILSVLCINLM